MQLYGWALTDYQFQVNITWARTQYSLGLNVALLGVVAAVSKVGRDANYLVIGVLVASLAITIFSVLAIDAGRSYYAPVTARIKALEEELGIERFGVRTTSSQGGTKPRFKVTTLLKGLFAALGTIEVAGIVYEVLAVLV